MMNVSERKVDVKKSQKSGKKIGSEMILNEKNLKKCENWLSLAFLFFTGKTNCNENSGNRTQNLM